MIDLIPTTVLPPVDPETTGLLYRPLELLNSYKHMLLNFEFGQQDKLLDSYKRMLFDFEFGQQDKLLDRRKHNLLNLVMFLVEYYKLS